MSVIVKQCTVAEIESASNFPALINEYSEYAIEGMPEPLVKMETYRVLERAGLQFVFGAFLGNTLVGFMSVLVSCIPHYGIIGTYSESLFVAKEHRKTGAGLKLIHAAESMAKNAGAPGLIISAPTHGILAEVLPEIGYTDTHHLFFRRLDNASYH